MSSTFSKVVIATTGIAGVGGGVTVAIFQLSTKGETVVNLLKQEQKSLLAKTGKDEAWKSNWKSFINAHENTDPNTNWNIEGWSQKKANPELVPEEFKNICYSNGNKRVKDKTVVIYGEVIKYCTENTNTPIKKSIIALLSANGKEILKKTSDAKGDWDKNWEEFKKVYNSLKTKEEWKFEQLEATMSATNDAPEEFKNRCENNAQKQITNDKEPLYGEIIKYCVKNP